jgi:D-3-phosphoglycerate dehydrogenase
MYHTSSVTKSTPSASGHLRETPTERAAPLLFLLRASCRFFIATPAGLADPFSPAPSPLGCDFGETDTAMIRNAALSGILNCFLSRKANLINASQFARDRAIGVSEVRRGRAHFSDSLKLELKTEDIDRSVEGTVFPDGSPRLLSIDGIYVEALLSGSLLYVRNKDVPGVIGRIGSALGEQGINISDFALGRGEQASSDEPAEAVALVRTDQSLAASVLDGLYRMNAVTYAKAIEL